jgi:peptidoglycan hydrolase-like protein with peptidoglycan-binding domain
MRYTVLLIGAVGASTALLTAPSTSIAQDTTRTRDTTQQEARGEVSRIRIDNRGLRRAQVERLQQRLNEMGCDAGPVDGLIGPRTRQAIACARQRENIPGNDIQELIRELGVDAQPLDSAAFPRPAMPRDTMRPPVRDTSMMRDTTMMRDPLRRDTLRPPRIDTLLQRDTIRRDTMPRRDTLRRDTTRRDTTRRDTLRDTLRDTVPLPPIDTTRRPPPR